MSSRPGLDLTGAVAAALRRSANRQLDFAGRIIAARQALSQAVVEGYDLDEMWRESDPDKRLPGRYRRHQVVTDTELGFTVVVLLWESGAVTPIHDHATWCVFGVLEGSLEITNYEVARDDGRGPLLLEECGRERLGAGLIGDNGDPAAEVHRVRNTGAERAVSLHAYGADLTQRTPFDGRAIKVAGKEACLAFQDQPAY